VIDEEEEIEGRSSRDDNDDETKGIDAVCIAVLHEIASANGWLVI
jgi:hypothetical protein